MDTKEHEYFNSLTETIAHATTDVAFKLGSAACRPQLVEMFYSCAFLSVLFLSMIVIAHCGHILHFGLCPCNISCVF